ncbi:hypothetical protein [Vibrio ishigakensis]|uniref:hypothetical protein n=1 Tax=Vibrio ishigakensis TaxID=1481914 RepID=UPI0021C3E213|nr:hypothetical protein [Vibrio ishigakensis]
MAVLKKFKYDHIKVGDVVYVATPVWSGHINKRGLKLGDYFLPYSVTKITPLFFDVENIGRFRKSDGHCNGASTFGSRAFNIGDFCPTLGRVSDQSKEYKLAQSREKLIEWINFNMMRYPINSNVLNCDELGELKILLEKNLSQYSSSKPV